MRAPILGIVVSVVLLATAGALYVTAGNRSGAPYRDVIEQVRGIQRLASSWSIEVARVRADPLAGFGSLAGFAPRMDRLEARLAGGIPALSERMAVDVNAYLGMVDAREVRIERFTTGYAVVRDAARQLPVAAANITNEALKAGDAGLAESIPLLVQDMNLYVATPTEAGKRRLGATLETLRAASVDHAPPLANALADLLTHAEVLLDRQAPVDALFEQATSDELDGFADRLAAALERERAHRDAVATRYEWGALATLGGLVLLWIALALRRRSRGAAAAPAGRAETAAALPAGGVEPVRAAIPATPGSLPAPVASPGIGGGRSAEAGPAELSAESAMLHRLLAERTGGSLVAAAGRIASRLDYLHQTNQKLQRVVQSSEYFLELPGGEDLDEELEASATVAARLRREINGIADLARRLASFSGLTNGDTSRAMVDVNACIEEVVAATRVASATEITTWLGETPELFASRTEIRLLLAQVVGNAVRAAEEIEGRAGSVKIDSELQDEEIRITIVDNGAGIPAERRKQIFRAFYTTREGALGLGLTVAEELVKKYQGSIRVSSLPGQGTVARITLPAAS